MDRRAMRERMRRKQRQIRRRKIMKLVTYAVAAVLAVIFVVRGIILPIAHRVGGGNGGETQEVQAEPVAADPNAAVRQPLKGQGDVAKVSSLTPGWHEDENGRWYQNADGTYYAGGFQEIEGVEYSFDENGYMQTGWVSKGVEDYYFNEDGSYNAEKKRPMLAITLDDGPGQYTDTLLDCLEEYGAHATFFMLGQNVSSYADTVKHMLDIGCELGSHSWDHTQLTTIDLDAVVKQYTDTDNALIQACGQPSTVARAPYGDGNSDIYNAVGKPFFMWSLDTEDWKLMDADADYNSVMNGDLTDGTIILMHDIHQPSVQAAIKAIPELISQGYKLVTVSELAQAKGVTLQNACYVDFWDSNLASGQVPGYEGNTESDSEETSDDGSEDYSDSSDEYSDGSDDSSGDYTDDGSEDYSDDSGYGDGSE